MVWVLGVWVVVTVVALALCIWIPVFAAFGIPLALTFIIASLIGLFAQQREHMEELEARLNRMETLLRERLPETDVKPESE